MQDVRSAAAPDRLDRAGLDGESVRRRFGRARRVPEDEVKLVPVDP